jgi:hypothetical protein
MEPRVVSEIEQGNQEDENKSGVSCGANEEEGT